MVARYCCKVSTIFSLSMYGDAQADDAGRDCRTRLARPNSQARTGTGKNIFPVQLTTSRIGNVQPCPVDLYCSAIYMRCDVMTIHTYMCVCVCVFIKLHITAQSGLVILVILCHSR